MEFKKRFMYPLMDFVPEIKCRTAFILLKIFNPPVKFRNTYSIYFLLFRQESVNKINIPFAFPEY